MEKTEIKDRILQLLREENLNNTKFAEILDIQASGVSHIISGRNKPSMDFIQKVLTRFTDISPLWLILGEGEMYKSNEPVQQVIDFGLSDGDKKNDASLPLTTSDSQRLENSQKSPEKPVNTGKKIKKIIVFYDNNTFEEFIHS